MSIETLYEAKIGDKPFLAIKKIVDPENSVKGYLFSHETRCNGIIIALMPFRKLNGILEFLMRNEITPCWGLQYQLSSITGGYEGGDPRDTTIIELKQEAGYEASKNELVSLNTSFASKSSDTTYYLYTIDLTNREQKLATTDGTSLEKLATCIWMTEQQILDHQPKDPQVYVLLTRLKVHLKL